MNANDTTPEMVSLSPEASPSLGKLAKALALAQLVMKDAAKDAVNPHFKNKYAPLPAVRSAITKPLADHGLSTLQTFEPHGDGGVCIVTWLLHESGEWIRSRLYLPVSKKDAQGFGSAITYGRRYALSAIAGIASDEDDDANAATGSAKAAVLEEKIEKASASKAVSDEAETGLARLFDAASNADQLAACETKAAAMVQEGMLTDAARARLRLKRSDAVRRVSNSAA